MTPPYSLQQNGPYPLGPVFRRIRDMFDALQKNRVARRLALAATAASLVAVPAVVGGFALRDIPVIQPAHADTASPVQMVPATFADLAAKVTPAVTICT